MSTLDLNIYVKVYEKKQTEFYGSIKRLERSLVLHLSRLSEMLSSEMSGMTTHQTHMYISSTRSLAQRNWV